MNQQDKQVFDQMRAALELAMENLRPHSDNCFLHDEGEYNACFCGKDSLVDHLQSVVESAALTAANAVSESALVHVDWQDMYWKEKRRSEMWVAKYEKDIGSLEKVYPQATEPQAQRELEEWLDANRMELIGSLHHELVARLAAHPQATEPPWQPIETCRYPDCKCPTESPCLKGLQPGNLKEPTP